jgi:hypothetical protein
MTLVKATARQHAVIEALKIVCGFEDWRFTSAPRRVVVIQSLHDIDYALKPDGSLTALPVEICDKCEGSGQINKKRGLGVSMRMCECVQRRHGVPDVTLKARTTRFFGGVR